MLLTFLRNAEWQFIANLAKTLDHFSSSGEAWPVGKESENFLVIGTLRLLGQGEDFAELHWQSANDYHFVDIWLP